jgi:hypothetical protein
MPCLNQCFGKIIEKLQEFHHPALPAGRPARFTSFIGLGTPPVQVYQPLVGGESLSAMFPPFWFYQVQAGGEFFDYL